MKNFSLIRSFLTEPWAISELSTSMYAPLVAGLFNDKIEFSKEDPILPEIKSVASAPGSSNQNRNINVSVITVSGALTKNDQECGPVGMATMQKWVNNAKLDSSCDAIFISFDTPGGTVIGTNELADEIESTKKIKPVIGFVSDLCCSGGYWLASKCTEIIANNDHAQVGSIGVMMTFQDVQPHYESLGVKFHTIRADQSSEKNTIVEELKAGNYERYKNEVLNPLADKFIGIVKESRPGVLDSQLTGDVYFANKVVGSLVDSIGNFEYALNRCAELAQNKTGNSAGASATVEGPVVTEKPNLNFDMKKTINKIIGVDVAANAEGNLVLTPAQAELIEQALIAAENDKTTVSTQSAKIVEHETTITAHLTTIATLGKGPGAQTSVAVTDHNAIITEESDSEDFATRFERVSKMVHKIK